MQCARSGLAAAGLGLLVLLTACQANSIDPTEQFFSIAFKNDSQRTVVLSYCKDGRCRSVGNSWRLTPSAVAHDTISDRGVFTRYLVSTTTGDRLGCLPVEFNRVYKDVVVRISQTVPCRVSTPLDVRHGPATDQDQFP